MKRISSRARPARGTSCAPAGSFTMPAAAGPDGRQPCCGLASAEGRAAAFAHHCATYRTGSAAETRGPGPRPRPERPPAAPATRRVSGPSESPRVLRAARQVCSHQYRDSLARVKPSPRDMAMILPHEDGLGGGAVSSHLHLAGKSVALIARRTAPGVRSLCIPGRVQCGEKGRDVRASGGRRIAEKSRKKGDSPQRRRDPDGTQRRGERG